MVVNRQKNAIVFIFIVDQFLLVKTWSVILWRLKRKMLLLLATHNEFCKSGNSS